MKAPATALFILAALLLSAPCASAGEAALSGREPPAGRSAPPFPDEPEAHALYDRMLGALREAETLSFESRYSVHLVSKNSAFSGPRYKISLKKPGFVRMEAYRDEKVCGVIVGGPGAYYKFWPEGRPAWGEGESGRNKLKYEEVKDTSYARQAFVGSIGYETRYLASGLGRLILDPSVFFGYTDSMQTYFEGARSLGSEKMGGQECDLIEVSAMYGLRRVYYWIGRTDHLPRRLKSVYSGKEPVSMEEVWSEVRLNGEIDDETFAWTPPEDWQLFNPPEEQYVTLEKGRRAPNFSLRTIDAGRLRLSDYRGRVVWLYFWGAG